MDRFGVWCQGLIGFAREFPECWRNYFEHGHWVGDETMYTVSKTVTRKEVRSGHGKHIT
jgi:hypothetical protein